MDVKVIVNGRTQWWQTLREAFEKASFELGFKHLPVGELSPGNAYPDRGGAVVFLHNPDAKPFQDPGLDDFVGEGGYVLPVAAQAGDLGRFPLPASIQVQNALIAERFKESWADAVVDEVMSELWIGRQKKKVFISYKRSDSEDLARQIHQELEHRRYSVFLDDCSISHGADFQRELFYWLNDADLVLLLASPNFAASRWLIQEIEFAKAHNVGLVAAVFDELKKKGTWSLEIKDALQRIPHHLRHQLPAFSGPLPKADLDALLAILLQERSRALHERMQSLLPAARSHVATVKGRFPDDSAENLGELRVGSELTVRVLPYRPSPENLWQLRNSGTAEIACFYEENDPHHSAAAALKWAIEGRRAENPLRVQLWTL